MDNQKDLLCTLLNCGEYDLELLNSIRYNWEKILDSCEFLADLSLNSLLRAVFNEGLSDINISLEEELERLENLTIVDMYDKEEIKNLKTLNPFGDIDYYLNCFDTDVYFNDSEVGEIYRKYIPEALDRFEFNTGFNIR